MATTARPHSDLSAENERLRSAVAEGEAREQATADVLRLIGEAAGDAQAALDAITERAARLCGAADATLFLLDGESVLTAPTRTIAKFGDVPPAVGTVFPPVPLDTARLHHGCSAMLDRQTVHILDQQSPDTKYPYSAGFAKQHGLHTYLAVPLLRGDRAIGNFQIRRSEVKPFTDQQIALVETFARQAAVAIENARLFGELQERLSEQTATAEVLRVIASSPANLPAVLQTVAEHASRLCETDDALISTFDGTEYTVAARHGSMALAPLRPGGDSATATRGSITGRALLEKRTVHVQDLEAEPDDEYPVSKARGAGIRTQLATPLLREGNPVGAITLRRLEVRPFSERHIKLLETFADQAVIAIENARLFNELRERLEEQTATAEVLREMGRSAFDLRPLLDQLGEHVYRLTGAQHAQIWQFDGTRLRLAAMHGATPAMQEFLRDAAYTPEELARAAPGRAALDRRVIQIDDLHAEPAGAWVEADEQFRRMATIRSLVAIPLLRGDSLAGVLTCWRERPEPFTPAQVALAQTFADQAAIAIENTRLFSELRERDDRRRQELERAAAIQRRLLPSVVEGWPGVLQIAHRFRPAVETSGDFYDVLRLAPRQEGGLPPLQIAVGDVAGKGMSAALVTALARTALRSTAAVPTQLATPAATLRLAGARLHEDVGGGHFVACALAVVEPPGTHHAGPLLRLANAAQVPVLLVRGGEAREIEPPGYRLPLGAQDDGAYKDAEVELRPGDVVVFSSDGLVEAPALASARAAAHLPQAGTTGELFGFARLAASASHWSRDATTAEAVAAGIWSDLTAWSGEDPHHDDMTLLVLRVPETGR